MGDVWRLPRRDIVLLPAICLVTLLMLVGIPEFIAERAFYEHKTDSCLRPDPVLGDRALPNCTARYKAGEGPWAENSYNACGYRTEHPCGPKPPGSFRVALIGSSTSMGYLIPYQQTFAVRTEKLLTRTCDRPVEFQSLGGLDYQWGRLEVRMDEALRLKPDLVVATLTPFDMRQSIDMRQSEAGPAPHGLVGGAVAWARGVVQGSSLWLAVLHYRSMLPTTYLKFFLRDPDRSDFLRQPFSPFWQQQVTYTGALLKHLSDKAQAAHVPMLLVFVPLRAQAVLLKHQAEFPDTVPLALDRAVGAFARQDGIAFMDFTATLAEQNDLNPLFYATADHINGAASAILADQLSNQIIAANYPGLQGCGPLKAASVTD